MRPEPIPGIVGVPAAKNDPLNDLQLSSGSTVRLQHNAWRDQMAATRYGIMMLRFASTKTAYDKFRRPIEYPKIKYV
jgi:hypothetical protein